MNPVIIAVAGPSRSGIQQNNSNSTSMSNSNRGPPENGTQSKPDANDTLQQIFNTIKNSNVSDSNLKELILNIFKANPQLLSSINDKEVSFIIMN